MANLIRLAIAIVLVLFLLGVGQIAGYRDPSGNFTLTSLVAVVALLALWVVLLFMALLPAISIYAPEKDVSIKRVGFLANWNPSKFQVLYYVGLSHGLTIYLFALAFKMISIHDAAAFNTQLESLGTALYFSIVTIATVGYGDIVPISSLARFFVSTEILAGLAYGVFFLSVIATFLREPSNQEARRKEFQRRQNS